MVLVQFTRLDETNNYAVIGAVSAVIGIYLIAVVLARRGDRRDAKKVIVCKQDAM